MRKGVVVLSLFLLAVTPVVAAEFEQDHPATPRVDVPEIQTDDAIPLANWTPASKENTPGGRLSAVSEGVPSDPSPFVTMNPCRVVDTRNAPGSWGGPYLAAGVARAFDLNSNPACSGIPTNVSAYSVNVTVTGPAAGGWITMWPYGATEPFVSTLNFLAGETVANAAIVPAGTSGYVYVKSVAAANVIIDINGYYRDGTVLSSGTASGSADTVGTVTWIYPTGSPTMSFPTGANCIVTSLLDYNATGAASASDFHVAVKVGTSDGYLGMCTHFKPFGVGPVDVTKTVRYAANPGENVRFGCAVYGSTGINAECEVTWSCF